MAQYTIITTRKQQIGLQFSYDNYADKTQYPSIESYFQFRISSQVTNPMYDEEQRAQSMSFDNSFNTVPETSQPKTRTEIEAVILSNGGTIVPAGPTGPPPTGVTGGIIPTTGREDSNSVQDGTRDKETE